MLSTYEILSALECALEYGCIEICFNYVEEICLWLLKIFELYCLTFKWHIFLNVIAAGSALTLDSQKHEGGA